MSGDMLMITVKRGSGYENYRTCSKCAKNVYLLGNGNGYYCCYTRINLAHVQ